MHLYQPHTHSLIHSRVRSRQIHLTDTSGSHPLKKVELSGSDYDGADLFRLRATKAAASFQVLTWCMKLRWTDSFGQLIVDHGRSTLTDRPGESHSSDAICFNLRGYDSQGRNLDYLYPQRYPWEEGVLLTCFGLIRERTLDLDVPDRYLGRVLIP